MDPEIYLPEEGDELIHTFLRIDQIDRPPTAQSCCGPVDPLDGRMRAAKDLGRQFGNDRQTNTWIILANPALRGDFSDQFPGPVGSLMEQIFERLCKRLDAFALIAELRNFGFVICKRRDLRC